MREDVIEFAQIPTRLREIPLVEGDVRKPECLNYSPAPCNGPFRKIDTRELAPGQFERHRNQVPAVATSQFQDAAALGRRRCHPQHAGDCGQPVRMRLCERKAGVKDLIVGEAHYGVARLPIQ